MHTMEFIREYEGMDEWLCPTCGRRLLMEYRPKFKKIILEEGDINAGHSGGKGGLQVGTIQIAPADVYSTNDESALPFNDPSLAPWLTWLNEVDFENLWNDDV